MITPTATTMRGMITSRMTASRALRRMAITVETMSITGARMSIRRLIASIMVRVLTSLVMRVMREAEEKRSMSAKEKVCILSNMAWRRLAPKPWLAVVAYLAPKTPKSMDAPARTSMITPSRKISLTWPLGMALSTTSAMTRGRRSWHVASSTMTKGERTAIFL